MAGELRQDLITGKWVLVASGRADRKKDYGRKKTVKAPLPKYKEDCPFCNLAKYPQDADVLRLPDDADEWQVHIFPNKYPAFAPKDDFRTWQTGPYRAIEAVGYHELLATRWHDEVEADVTEQVLAIQLEALVLRYRQLREKPAVNYIQIIKNHGELAGASIEHPHNQIFTVPVLPSDVQDMLRGVELFTAKNGKDPFTVMMDFEKSEATRVVSDNDQFTAFCPYASRFIFETWIMPNSAEPYFENLDKAGIAKLAQILKDVLSRIKAGLNSPDYNYYIYSAPCDDTGMVCEVESFQHWRWHMVIVPRIGSWGGFELGTGLEITEGAPEKSAEILREQVRQEA